MTEERSLESLTANVFDDLVDAAVEKAVAQEREECAKLAEEHHRDPYVGKHIALDIRARGEPRPLPTMGVDLGSGESLPRYTVVGPCPGCSKMIHEVGTLPVNRPGRFEISCDCGQLLAFFDPTTPVKDWHRHTGVVVKLGEEEPQIIGEKLEELYDHLEPALVESGVIPPKPLADVVMDALKPPLTWCDVLPPGKRSAILRLLDKAKEYGGVTMSPEPQPDAIAEPPYE